MSTAIVQMVNQTIHLALVQCRSQSCPASSSCFSFCFRSNFISIINIFFIFYFFFLQFSYFLHFYLFSFGTHGKLQLLPPSPLFFFFMFFSLDYLTQPIRESTRYMYIML
uniref:Uncharacterized protein n=1 Tax=Cacopsylla melanoneura TaxID=428564 RepID=A0A8D8TTQ8_9HEMI